MVNGERVPLHPAFSPDRAVLTSVLDPLGLYTDESQPDSKHHLHIQPVVIALVPISFTLKDAKGIRLSRDPRHAEIAPDARLRSKTARVALLMYRDRFGVKRRSTLLNDQT